MKDSYIISQSAINVIDDDDEFGGMTVDINELKAKCNQVSSPEIDEDEDDEFGGLTVDINDLKAKSTPIDLTLTTEIKPELSTIKNSDETINFKGKSLKITPTYNTNSSQAEVLELPNNWDEIGIDSEYQSNCDKATTPFSISLHSAGNCGDYLHPESHAAKFYPILIDIRRKLKKIGESDTLEIFKSPLVVLDFLADTYNIQWRDIKDLKRNRVRTLKLYFFFSFKDLEFLWSKSSDYQYYCLPFLERIRRITTKFNKPIALPFEVLIPTKKGDMKWHCLSLDIVDISAMQGTKGLKTYLQNVGLPSDIKTVWDWEQNNSPLEFFLEKPREYVNYIRGDVKYLKPVHDKTTNFYNEIASTIGVEARKDWGKSTGKITASIVSQWIANRDNIQLPVIDEENGKKSLYWFNRFSSPESMKQLSHLTGNTALLYLGMTDGGRCVKERSTIDVLQGLLVDIDINGCYGNGLKNQIFPIGNPSIITDKMTFGEWEKLYVQNLVPGLWGGRISWKDAPFKQDLLLSKEEKAFTSWDWYQSHFSENNSDTDKQYDASMYLATNQVHMAAFTHDLYQVILNYAGDNELAWIRNNAVIECFAYYDKRDEINKVIPEMCETRSIKDIGFCGLNWCTKWVRVELRELATILIAKRAVHKNKVKLYNKHFGKDNKDAIAENIPDSKIIDGIEFTKIDWLYQSSVQEFVKLIVNTIYGCIASSYFAGDGTGISNFIIGNNITARARTLAWCMAKGLYSLMSVTDGGVFDANNVAFYLRKSLNIFAELGFENFNGKDRTPRIEIKPLYGCVIPVNDSMFQVLDKINHVEKLAWQHLKETFSELDIFKYDQFSFEVKKIYTECEIRNKSDYRLRNKLNGEETIRIRGLSKKNGKDGDDVAASIFDDIANGQNAIRELTTKRLLGLSEWREMDSEKRKTLLPHDEVSETKKFYSFTPLGCKFVSSAHRKEVLKLYDKLKEWEKPELMELLRMLENVTDNSEFQRIRKLIKNENKKEK